MDRWTDRHGQTERQTDESDITGCCPTNIERPVIDWKTIWKFCVTIISGLHFDRASRISCEKYDEKCYDHWYHSILLNVYNY